MEARVWRIDVGDSATEAGIREGDNLDTGLRRMGAAGLEPATSGV
jgi:hypothetical protein